MNKQWTIALCLLLASIFVRLPFYFVDVVNWDESTFILMGQSLLDGHLPYTELWDIKPPVAFAAFALFILLLGKSIMAIRIAGTICVFLTAWFIYLIGKKIGSEGAGIFAGLMSIVGLSTIRGAQATMTEHVAVVLLAAALVWLTTRQLKPLVLFFGGILLTLAALVRLNLAFVVVAIGFWLVYGLLRDQSPKLKGIFAYCGGSFGTIFLTYVPYLLTGKSSIWFDSVVLAPLSYSGSGEDPAGYKLILLLIGFWLLYFLWCQISRSPQREFSLLQVTLLGIVVSIVLGGEFHQHYYIQGFPFLALTLALFWCKLPIRLGRMIIVALASFFLVLELNPVYAKYGELSDRWIGGQPLNHGTAYEIVAYLEQHNPTNEPVYMMKDHIVYWFTDLKPLSKVATHPSNLGKEYLYQYVVGATDSMTAELAQIFAQKPQFVVKRIEEKFIESNPPLKRRLEQILTTEYELTQQIGDREIYHRR
ncbi:MAG: glycosyltransferase family 39 protein [Cyanobacteria bacterium J06623_7]